MPDVPDTRPGHHEHLYLHDQVVMARHEIQRSWNPRPIMASCQLCGAQIDLTKVVTVQQPHEEDLPPVRGWGQWRRDR